MMLLLIIFLVIVFHLILNKKKPDSTRDDGTKAVQIMVTLKYLSKFSTNVEMYLINCEINFILLWSGNCVISSAAAGQAATFAVTDTKLYAPVVTLSSQYNAKLLQQLKPPCKRTINWNKYHSKTQPLNTRNPYLDFLIHPSFQGVNRLFVLWFNAIDDGTGYTRYYH